ncbi:MAG: HlyD family efflux transporter periplasmic adaptor subunit, partial [Candidatus Dadabacteria bacterium]|nr:HlyD family efflux transporter periplasmic adaptor subunit [Candidatus Dadabacteria bacterium]NIQ16650.1 HlyD family efflux transporter periplasmic adaptor subunit [Candidatus Dadabacteria bacterium]
MNNNRMKTIIILILIIFFGIGLYFFGSYIPIINKIPHITKNHDHLYKPVFDEQGKIEYWTCAMHPSVRLEKPDRCPICGMDTTPVWKKEDGTHKQMNMEKNDSTESEDQMVDIQGHDHSRMGVQTKKTINGDFNSKFTVSPERQQLIGVKTQPVMVREIKKDIRTVGVGIVELDETRIEHIHTKISGWIENVFVDFIGQSVKKGEPIFSIYSPELVSTQEEYLLALKSKNILDKSEFEEIYEAGNSLLKASKRRLELWDISSNQIKQLEETGQVKKNLVIYSPISGIVMEKNVFENKHVNPDQTLYVIADHSKVWVQVDIYENEISLINLGDTAVMTLASFPGEEFP